MSAEHLVRALCARHGLPSDAGTPFLPLVRKALLSPDGVRERILRLVDEALAERSEALADARPGERGDDQVLVAVARVLHQWTPSESMLDLGSSLDRQEE
jgi:hypothetical protein